MTSGIYLIRNKVNDKKYVGKSKSIEIRWQCHKRKSTKTCRYLHNAIIKYGIDNFEFSILESVDSNNPDLQKVLVAREIFWISYLDTVVDHQKGYNLTLGGEGGGMPSAEALKRRSAALKKVIHTPEWNAKVRESLKGKPRPAISLAKKGVPNPKVSLAQKGVYYPNRSKAQKGSKKNFKKNNHIKAININSGEEINFRTKSECNLYFTGKRTDTSIKRLIEGYIPIHKGRLLNLYKAWKFTIL
jgi:group I intron endonuclease